jgi:hypothetical protein
MAKSFDNLVKRTTPKKTQAKASRRTRELLGELLLSELWRLAGKSQRQVADALSIKQPSLSKQNSSRTCKFRRCERSSKPSAENSKSWRDSPKERSRLTSLIHRRVEPSIGERRNCN